MCGKNRTKKRYDERTQKKGSQKENNKIGEQPEQLNS